MDEQEQAVYDQAVLDAAALTDRQIRRGFRHAAASFREYAELCDISQAAFAMHWINSLLDACNDRRREKR